MNWIERYFFTVVNEISFSFPSLTKSKWKVSFCFLSIQTQQSCKSTCRIWEINCITLSNESCCYKETGWLIEWDILFSKYCFEVIIVSTLVLRYEHIRVSVAIFQQFRKKEVFQKVFFTQFLDAYAYRQTILKNSKTCLHQNLVLKLVFIYFVNKFCATKINFLHSQQTLSPSRYTFFKFSNFRSKHSKMF